MSLSMVNPCSSDDIKSSAFKDGYAAKSKEQEKNSMFSRKHLPSGHAPSVIPIVFNFGSRGKDARGFLKFLSCCSRDQEDVKTQLSLSLAGEDN